MDVSDLVRREVNARFNADHSVTILRELALTPLPFLDASNRRRDRDRVHLAILKQADGDLTRFMHYLALAADDWRDILVAAGLANEDWPDVLRAGGFPVP
jgi:hypothetical protein